ncbi:MAG: CDP-glucose 4,6-dehydratase [Chitinophagaceae bacterium]|nr:CDP-glucose 4,6-dehydratase [Chitinophagaceae bacterium]
MLRGIETFYKGKKVFLTGHTGFKGSWLLFWLKSMGAEVKGYSLNPLSEKDLYNQMGGENLCQSVIADIRDSERLENELLAFEPDLVFHLAAQPLVLLSYEEPELTYETNVLGTGYLLKAIRKLNKPCAVILITTDKVYENREWVYPYRENDPLGGYDPYSSSKAACEILINSYRQSFFNPKLFDSHKKAIAVARAGNVIGGGDWSENRIIPDIIRALQSNQKIIVRNPNAVRPWQHVLEPLGGYLLLGKRLYEEPLRFCEAWNFGPYLTDTFTVSALVKKAINIWGSGEISNAETKSVLHEAGLLKLDISKVASVLNWYPKLNCNLAIEKTITWYKSAAYKKTAELMANDISDYLAIANEE